MRIVSEEKVDNDGGEQPTARMQPDESDPEGGPADETTSDATSLEEFFEEGQGTTIAGDMPEGMRLPGQEPQEQPSTSEESTEGDDTSQEQDQPTDEQTAEDETTEGDDVEQADDVATSVSLDRVQQEAGLNVEDDEDLIDTLNNMRRDLQGTEQFRELMEQVPEFGEIVGTMLDRTGEEGEVDTISFLMSLEDVPGVEVNIPDQSELPEEHDDFRLKMRERRRQLKDQREKAKERQRKQQQILEDMERAWDSFKERKGLDDEEAEEFRKWFGRRFYGDQEKGELPKLDIFDIGWEHYKDDDTPTEETEDYKQGWNDAIEEMQSGGASGDGVPNMLSAGGSGDDSPETPEEEQTPEDEAMGVLYSKEELEGGPSIHDQF